MVHSPFIETLIHYKYWLIFPIAIVEGPIIGIITGFLISLNYLNFWIGFLVLESGDLIGDSLYYLAGRFGRVTVIEKYGHHIGITAEKILKVEKYFESHSKKTLVFGKFAHGTGSILWIAAGMARLNYYIFLVYNSWTTAIKVAILILIGFYFGEAYQSFDRYLDYLATFFILVLIGIYILAVKTNLLSRFFDDEQ